MHIRRPFQSMYSLTIGQGQFPYRQQPLGVGSARSNAQALVEFAFIAVILTLLIMGTVEFGRAFSAWIQVGNIARAGAQYGSVAATFGDDELNDVNARALEEQSTIYGTSPSVSSEVLTDAYGYCSVLVTTDYEFVPLFQIGPIPNSITVSRTAQMRLQFIGASLEDECK